ncbi:MAG: hypothetical protein ACYCU5_03520 [Actinomycetes bacterium]
MARRPPGHSGFLVVEHTDGRWAGFEVELGGGPVDQAAGSLTRMAHARVASAPSALGVITATEHGYRQPDGVWVIPLGCLGP